MWLESLPLNSCVYMLLILMMLTAKIHSSKSLEVVTFSANSPQVNFLCFIFLGHFSSTAVKVTGFKLNIIPA